MQLDIANIKRSPIAHQQLLSPKKVRKKKKKERSVAEEDDATVAGGIWNGAGLSLECGRGHPSYVIGRWV